MIFWHIRILFILTLLFIGNSGKGFSQERGSSAPFISGDTFRAYADHIFDETTSRFNPKKVKSGDVIFVKTDGKYLDTFFRNYHPKIGFPYILVTHNSDCSAPGAFAPYLDDPKLLAWFAQNVEGIGHFKLFPIPIGIANKCWDHGNPSIFSNLLSSAKNVDKPFLCYLNFEPSTYPKERLYVWSLFHSQPWCVSSKPKALRQYLRDLSFSKFVLSPRGNGLDCHRTWEALLMGAIPVVFSSTLDPLYEDLPVLIVNDWTEITESYLDEQYKKIKSKKHNTEKMFIKYWIEQIHEKAKK
jgi:hypothetical protein